LVLALSIAAGFGATPHLAAAAQSNNTEAVSLVVFYGQVTSVVGVAGSPTGFTLLLKNRAVDFRIAPHATLKPMSAEAEVEGFQVNDYAAVGAKRINRVWVAFGIQFDVQSFRGTVIASGIVAKLTPNGKRLELQLDNGTLRWVTITLNTVFRIGGQTQASAPVLLKGETVEVRMRPTPTGWVALEINLKLTPPPARQIV
jgi:hypothetical protein